MSDWSPDLGRLQAFDDGEWFEVERHYAGRLYAYVARRVLDAQAREDVVQESFLGAVRGIASFDDRFTFEQYLFGICRNRTIDHLRRRRATTLGSEDDDGPSLIDQLARDDETPSRVVRSRDLQGRGRDLLVDVLRDWVQETWEAEEFKRLMVIEALFAGGWRNRDTWERFELRDETAVAGIKFRALKRLRELAARRDASGAFPARHWLARHVAGTLEGDPSLFLQFHLEEMKCPWCLANRDDLERSEASLEPLLEKVRASTARYLRSKTL